MADDVQGRETVEAVDMHDERLAKYGHTLDRYNVAHLCEHIDRYPEVIAAALRAAGVDAAPEKDAAWLAELRATAEAALPIYGSTPARVDIDRQGTCDGCAANKTLVASYPEPDNEPWLCAYCAVTADYDAAFDPPTVLALLDLAARQHRAAPEPVEQADDGLRERVEALCVAAEVRRGSSVTFDGTPFPAMVSADAIRAALTPPAQVDPS